jgi:hypothetical protein
VRLSFAVSEEMNCMHPYRYKSYAPFWKVKKVISF